MSVWISALSGYSWIFLTPSELGERFDFIAQAKTSISDWELQIYLIDRSLDGKRVKNTFSSVLGRRRRQKFSPAALKQSILVHFYCFKSPPQAKKKLGYFRVFKNTPIYKNAPPYLSQIFSRGAFLSSIPLMGSNKFQIGVLVQQAGLRELLEFMEQ